MFEEEILTADDLHEVARGNADPARLVAWRRAEREGGSFEEVARRAVTIRVRDLFQASRWGDARLWISIPEAEEAERLGVAIITERDPRGIALVSWKESFQWSQGRCEAR